MKVNSHLQREIADFVTEILPLFQHHPHIVKASSPLLASCVDSENGEQHQQEQEQRQCSTLPSLLRVGLECAKESREDGNLAFKVPNYEVAVGHYKVAMRVAEWAAGLALVSSDSDEDCDFALTLTRQIQAVAVACTSNAAYALVLMLTSPSSSSSSDAHKKHRRHTIEQAQRWCERGIHHANFLLSSPDNVRRLNTRITLTTGSSSSSSSLPSAASLSLSATAPAVPSVAQLTVIAIKMQFRLGQTLEVQHAWDEAISAFAKCRADAESPNKLSESDSALQKQLLADCDAKLASCRAARVEARSKMSGMFA